MPSSKQQDKFNFPGLARTIVRPVVRTTRAVVVRGEKVAGDIVGLASHAVKNTISGSKLVATGVVRRSSKVVRNVAGLATGTVRDTVDGSKKIVKGVAKDSKKIVRDTVRGKQASKK
jgi:hypothetical protein